MKTCPKCEVELEATLENFGPDKRTPSGLQSWCRACNRARSQEAQGRPGAKAKQRSRMRAHRKTIPGYLRVSFISVNERCYGTSHESYKAKGIENKFESAEHLIRHVVEVLKVDPRGKQCHRIDNDGNYEPGNIEFLTRQEHDKVHAEMSVR